ncbi:MAG: hypothetical protein AAGC46_07965, partial [Solirubrobacteraceae bacterium]
YQAAGTEITGASTRTTFEFALTGRGSKQHLVYIAGSRVRDASCDGRPAAASLSGLILYNDELDRRDNRVRGTRITARFRNGEESLTARAASSRTITGTFRFGSYTGCPAGGHFTFRATRSPGDKPTVATALLGIG